jgi:AraC-like DNA-binding protein/ligand-binding sensor protein
LRWKTDRANTPPKPIPMPLVQSARPADPLRPAAPSPVRLDTPAAIVAHLQQTRLFLEYQQAFEATTGLPLVLRAAGSFRTPLEGSKRLNAFCALMTRANPTCAACLLLQERIETAATRVGHTQQCYAGLSESVVPVLVGEQVLGYLQTGQVFLSRPSRARFRILARTLPGVAPGIPPDAWETAYFQTRVLDRKQYGMILQLLGVFAEHLGAVSNRLFIGATREDIPMVAKARAFIAEHHAEPLRMGEVARAVHVSPFHFSRVFNQAVGQTFTLFLARVRIEAVKVQLLVPGMRVSEAAFAAGFQSLSQFNRQYHRITGEAPSRYRDRLHP